MKTKQMVEIVEKHIDNMFLEAVDTFGIHTGDVTPDQHHELEDIKDDLYFLLTAYINQNQPSKESPSITRINKGGKHD